MIRITAFTSPDLSVDNWTISSGDAWCVVGPNGSGKQFIDRLLLGQLKDHGRGSIIREIPVTAINLVSFEQQQSIFEQELKLAATDLLPESETATKAIDFLPPDKTDDPLIDALNLRHRLDQPYTQLSTGESRKLLIAQALLQGAEVLILDNPFDSLDHMACDNLSAALKSVWERGTTVVFLLSNRDDIPAWCSALATVKNGVLQCLDNEEADKKEHILRALFAATEQPDWPEHSKQLTDFPHEHIINIANASVRYGQKVVLRDLTLQLAPLEHTLITGENGAGKSTLLGLITGDNPQSYNNDVRVLGYRRGHGESIWELKQQMGIVSSELHRFYRVRCDALTVVCSGFFDSIGVYEQISEVQVKIAKQWLQAAGLREHATEPFHTMSYGEQRLVLIARALVKSPLLLVLDEPTQGLDELNRSRILDLLITLENRRHTTLIFVSHRHDEYLPLFKRHLHLKIPVAEDEIAE
ncbi:MAG: ATP-binding cassette domain-containing protein [Halieaceae bacterium]|nr:ATP-binding cassette domain-containing protein [Halieaceae bacterium]